MTIHPALRVLAAALLAAGLTACKTAEQAPPPAPLASTSTGQAEERLKLVAAERATIEASYTEREIVCYEKFFVNRCLDEARETRRIALGAQRAIEIEAERYLRAAKVDARDRAMAEAEANYQAEDARLAADPAPVKTPDSSAPKPRAKPAQARAARHQAREQDNAARLENDAAKRAANAAAFEERRRKSEQRQKEVAERVAEREAKAARQAAEAAAKAKPAPAQ